MMSHGQLFFLGRLFFRPQHTEIENEKFYLSLINSATKMDKDI